MHISGNVWHNFVIDVKSPIAGTHNHRKDLVVQIPDRCVKVTSQCVGERAGWRHAVEKAESGWRLRKHGFQSQPWLSPVWLSSKFSLRLLFLLYKLVKGGRADALPGSVPTSDIGAVLCSHYFCLRDWILGEALLSGCLLSAVGWPRFPFSCVTSDIGNLHQLSSALAVCSAPGDTVGGKTGCVGSQSFWCFIMPGSSFPFQMFLLFGSGS